MERASGTTAADFRYYTRDLRATGTRANFTGGARWRTVIDDAREDGRPRRANRVHRRRHRGGAAYWLLRVERGSQSDARLLRLTGPVPLNSINHAFKKENPHGVARKCNFFYFYFTLILFTSCTTVCPIEVGDAPRRYDCGPGLMLPFPCSHPLPTLADPFYL